MVEITWNEDGTFNIEGLNRVELVYTELGMADLLMKIHRQTPDSKYEKMVENIVMPLRKALFESDGDITEFGAKIVNYIAESLEGKARSDITTGEIAKGLDIDVKVVVGGLTKLINGGYVMTDDDNASLIYLTSKGWKFAGKLDG